MVDFQTKRSANLIKWMIRMEDGESSNVSHLTLVLVTTSARKIEWETTKLPTSHEHEIF
jgi:hypothetical protein